MDLKLPIIKGPAPKDRHLKMSDYLKFVMFNLKYTVDIAAARKAKKKMFVGKPFVFK